MELLVCHPHMPFSLGISDSVLSYQIKLSSPYPAETIHLPDRPLAHAPGVGTIFGRFCQISLHQRFEPRMYHVTNPNPENLYKPAQTQITSFLWVPWPTGLVWLMIVSMNSGMRVNSYSYNHYVFIALFLLS